MEYKHLTKVLEEYGKWIVERLINEIEWNDINASGRLAKSIHYMLESDKGAFSISLGLEEYYKWVLGKGRGPTQKDGTGELRRNLDEWIQMKPIMPSIKENGKLPTIDELSYLISRKIHTEGYKGADIWDKSIDDANQMFMTQIEEALQMDIEEEIDILLLHLSDIK